MELSQEKVGNVKIIIIKGKIDSQTDSFSDDMDKVIEGETNVLVDCTNMDYINSAGLRVFLTSLKKVTSVKGKFSICNLNDGISEIFNIAGFSSIFQIFDSRVNALAEMGL